MFVTYKPEGQAESKGWEFDPQRVKASQAEMIEKRYGKPFEVWFADLRTGAVKARRVLLWHLIMRDGHPLKYEDTPDFALSELQVEQSVAEILELQAQTEKMDLTEEERHQAEVALGAALADALEREGGTLEEAEQEAAPKAE